MSMQSLEQLDFRIQFKILLITFKIHGLSPSYLSSLISLRCPAIYNLLLNHPRFISKATLIVLHLRCYKALECFAFRCQTLYVC